MVTKKRGDDELHPRYQRIIRSMLISNFVLTINDRITGSNDHSPEDALDLLDDVNEVSLVRYCG